MEIAPLKLPDRQIIHGYGNGGFLVSEHTWRGAIIVLPKHTVTWSAESPADFDLTYFAPVRESLDPPIELLLIGTGRRTEFIKPSLRAELKAMGLAVETMDTGAACRTYNILVSEERRVAAALLPVG
jgi:uncharacterized protein